jgi:hypothetical protein
MPLGKTPAFRMLFIGLVVSAVWFAATNYCYSAGDFDVAVNVSRTGGLAPLSVFFDATAATARQTSGTDTGGDGGGLSGGCFLSDL